MPHTRVVFFREEPGDVPVLYFLQELRELNEEAYARCAAAIGRLAASGHELRRPTADYLRDDIYELRVRCGRVHYRILYAFHGRQLAVLAHALAKEGRVPPADIVRAIRRMDQFRRNPAAHTYEEELP